MLTGPLPPGHPEAAQIALQYLGVPYVWGAPRPSGFDCSGLVSYVFAQLGISLPHFAAAQWDFGAPVTVAQLQPGDLVFFDGLDHVGIYLGNDEFIDAPHTGAFVRIDTLSEPWYAKHYVGARRISTWGNRRGSPASPLLLGLGSAAGLWWFVAPVSVGGRWSRSSRLRRNERLRPYGRSRRRPFGAHGHGGTYGVVLSSASPRQVRRRPRCQDVGEPRGSPTAPPPRPPVGGGLSWFVAPVWVGGRWLRSSRLPRNGRPRPYGRSRRRSFGAHGDGGRTASS